MSDDRFESLRVPIDCVVDLRLDPGSSSTKVPAGNISMSGMFLRTAEIHEPGTLFEVRFRLQDGEPPITGRAEVLWCRPRDRGPDAGEIRAIRERFGLSQSVFAQLLRLGSNTISRWESGRKVQTAALDVLLRLVRDQPSNLEYLRHNAA